MKLVRHAAVVVAALAALGGTTALVAAHWSGHSPSALRGWEVADRSTASASTASPSPRTEGDTAPLPSLPATDRDVLAAHGMVLLPADGRRGVISLEKAKALALGYTQAGANVVAASLAVTHDPGSAVDDGCLCWIVKIQLAHPIPPQDACLGCAGAHSTPSGQSVRSVLVYVDATNGRFVEASYGGGIS